MVTSGLPTCLDRTRQRWAIWIVVVHDWVTQLFGIKWKWPRPPQTAPYNRSICLRVRVSFYITVRTLSEFLNMIRSRNLWAAAALPQCDRWGFLRVYICEPHPPGTEVKTDFNLQISVLLVSPLAHSLLFDPPENDKHPTPPPPLPSKLLLLLQSMQITFAEQLSLNKTGGCCSSCGGHESGSLGGRLGSGTLNRMLPTHILIRAF